MAGTTTRSHEATAPGAQQQHAPQIPAAWAHISSDIRARLEHEGLDSAGAWRAAGKRRRRVFGIVPSVVKQLDQLAKAAT